MAFLKKVKSRLFETYAEWVWGHRYLVFILSCLLTAGATHFVSQIRLDSNQASLLPEDTPSVKNLKRVSEIYGGAGHVITVIRGEDYDATLKYINEAAGALSQLEEVRYVDYKNPITSLDSKILLYAETADLKKIYARLYLKIDYEKEQAVGLDLGLLLLFFWL